MLVDQMFLAKRHKTKDKVSKIDCLRFVVCPLQAPVLKGFFFAVAIKSTNGANKAGGTRC
jgi:hypothetical protein